MALSSDVANLTVALKLDDAGFSNKLRSIKGQLSGLEGGLSRIGTGAGQVAGGLDRLATRGALLAAGGLAAVVTTAVSFEDAFAEVRKTVAGSEADLDALNETFRAMAREIPLSFEELSAIGGQAGALGIATDSIEEFTRVAALIGVTTDVASDQAATSLGVLSNILHLTAEDYDNFGSALVDLGNKGASTESQILGIAERAGAGAALIDISADKTLGWSSALANLGIEVEAGGTALQKFFLDSLQLIQDDDTLQVFADTAGTTADAFKTAFETDASGALETFIAGLGKLSDAEQLGVLNALGFTDVRITRALLGLAGNTDNLTQSLDTAGAAWEENTALTAEAEKRFKTTRSQLTLLKNNVRDAANTIGSELLPVITDMTQEFIAFLNQPGTQRDLKQFASDLASGIRTLVGELRGTDFSGIIEGIRVAADASKAAFAAFRSLPPELQSLAVAAIVANKATGGAVGMIGKGLANIVGGFLGLRGTSPANPLWVQSVGGVGGGTPGTPGAGGGGLGGVVAGFVGTAGAIATTAGGVSAVAGIVEGTEKGVKSGFAALSGGFPSLIARAITDVIGDPLGDLIHGQARESDYIQGQTGTLTAIREGTFRTYTAVTGGASTTAQKLGTALSLQASALGSLQQVSAGVRNLLPPTQGILAKKSTFNVAAYVSISASGVLSQTSTYARIREG